MKRLPPLHCLQALEAVARLGSVVAAADELCVTASAVSHRLKQFEAWLGQPLIARPQPLTLTPHAIQYAVAARTALQGLEALPAPRPDSRQRLTIAVPPTFARNVLVPHLTGFTSANPAIEMELQLTIPLSDIKAGEPDVEVRFGSGQYPDADVAERLLADRVFPVATPAYLESTGPFRAPADLRKARLLRSPLEPWRMWFQAAGLDWPEPTQGVQYNDLGILMEAAVASQGIALARPTLARRWLTAGLLVPVFELAADSPHAYWLLYEQSSLGRHEVRLFIDWLKQTVSKLAAEG
jgi:LysR family transcriptional regulator, glycine cleavage system transcriptional activator